jgi:hypothetical protein
LRDRLEAEPTAIRTGDEALAYWRTSTARRPPGAYCLVMHWVGLLASMVMLGVVSVVLVFIVIQLLLFATWPRHLELAGAAAAMLIIGAFCTSSFEGSALSETRTRWRNARTDEVAAPR